MLRRTTILCALVLGSGGRAHAQGESDQQDATLEADTSRSTRHARIEKKGGGFVRDLAGETLMTGIANTVTSGFLVYESLRGVTACRDQAPEGQADDCELSGNDKDQLKTAGYLGLSSAGLLVGSWLLYKFTDPETSEVVYQDEPAGGSATVSLLKELPWTKYTLFLGSATGSIVAVVQARDAQAALRDPMRHPSSEETEKLVSKARTARSSAVGLLIMTGMMGVTAFRETMQAIGNYEVRTTIVVEPTAGGGVAGFALEF